MLKKSMTELQRLNPEEAQNAPKTGVAVLLENVRSMQNVGSVFRTCDGFMIEKLLLCGYTPHPPHRDINKTALGATETVFWDAYTNSTEAIIALKNQGYIILAVEQTHNSCMLHEYQFRKDLKYAIILGNEAEGVQEDTIAAADGCIEIPQFGSKHSFNISVAAGIVLWEMVKQLKA
jgi:23S rRNA (guanosine2251-2'-O)-methyltransferase